MKKYLLSILPALLLAAIAVPAHAGDMRGRIEAVDTEANQFTLRNGVSFQYGDDIDETGLAEGAKVKVKYESDNGYFVVKRLKVTSPAGE